MTTVSANGRRIPCRSLTTDRTLPLPGHVPIARLVGHGRGQGALVGREPDRIPVLRARDATPAGLADPVAVAVRGEPEDVLALLEAVFLGGARLADPAPRFVALEGELDELAVVLGAGDSPGSGDGARGPVDERLPRRCRCRRPRRCGGAGRKRRRAAR